MTTFKIVSSRWTSKFQHSKPIYKNTGRQISYVFGANESPWNFLSNKQKFSRSKMHCFLVVWNKPLLFFIFTGTPVFSSFFWEKTDLFCKNLKNCKRFRPHILAMGNDCMVYSEPLITNFMQYVFNRVKSPLT